MRLLPFYFALFLFTQCTELEPRKPLNKTKDDFIKVSAARNKIQFTQEEQAIKKTISIEKELDYRPSQSGFWLAYKAQGDTLQALPKKGDIAHFRYQIENLSQELIYSEEELGTVDYPVDEDNFLPALREGIRILRPGDVVVFLFPSYLCYGYQGDGEKIGINQPLRITLKLLSIDYK